MRKFMAIYSVLVFTFVLVASTARADPSVSLELVTERGFPLTGTQRWMAALKDVGFSGIRIRSAQSGDRNGIKTLGRGSSIRYQVTGILSSRNKLELPAGGTFSVSDIRGIRSWVERLKEGGQEGLTARRGAFGLTSKQLVAVNEAMSAKVTFSTKGQAVGEVVRNVMRTIPLEFSFEPAAREALASQEVVAEEMQGLTAGTVLAASVRPLGLVVAPYLPRGGKTRLLIADVRRVDESWPIGWPLNSNKPPKDLVPKLFDYLNVEIEDFKLSDALDALQKRLQVPFLFDHNSLARHDIDPAQVKVSLPKGRTYYKRVISRLLSQANLKSELRIDEAGKPFYWITTIKR